MPKRPPRRETKTETKANYRRCRTALRFDRVNACKCRNLDQTDKDARLNLLAVEFAETDAPAGAVSLIFSGGGVIRLDVECLEAELADLGEVSAAALCPNHFAAGIGDGVIRQAVRGAVRLDVECLEAELADLGEAAAAALCPNHFAAGAATA